MWIAKSRPSSIATISAHPMFRPSVFQPTDNLQASHSPLKTIPMPHDEEASTQKSTEEAGGGLDKEELQKAKANFVHHQSMSDRTLGLGDLRTKGDVKKLKEAAKREIEGR